MRRKIVQAITGIVIGLSALTAPGFGGVASANTASGELGCFGTPVDVCADFGLGPSDTTVESIYSDCRELGGSRRSCLWLQIRYWRVG